MPVRAAHTSAIALGEEPAGHESEDLRRRLVEPLRVVGDHHERLPFCDLGEEGQRSEAHQESVRGRAGAQSEDGRERLTLRVW